jgi:hypothetical protein
MSDMNKVTSHCLYVKREDYYNQKVMISNCKKTETEKHDVKKLFSKHNIDNAFMDIDLPLSDQSHGIFRMTPPERLHTTSEGLSKYMVESLKNTICDVGDGKKLLNQIEKLHQTLYYDMKRNSERDFPRGSARNGALKNTLVSATERRGNMFLLLCLCHTDVIREPLEATLRYASINPNKCIKCLKLYIAMEEWFHENNPIQEVKLAHRLVGETLELIHHAFPRLDKHGNEEGQG